jgi:hypothetical protein
MAALRILNQEVDMVRAGFVLACLGIVIHSTAIVDAQRGMASASPQAVFRADVDAMATRLGAGGVTSRQAIADARRIVAGYRSFGPLVRTFGPADYALNREVARRSLYWLSRAGALYATDPFAVRAFLDAYDVIGGFYRDYGGFYAPGAYVAYASAARLAQRLTHSPHDPLWFTQALDRYALAYGTLATLNGMLVPRWTMVQDLPAADAAPREPPAALTPLPPPTVDVTGLDAAQRQLWADARDRFRSASSSVHGARVLLDQLSERLRRQGLTLNPATAATALKMQSALEDASELLQAREFESAIELLRSAEAHRAKLRSATGQ